MSDPTGRRRPSRLPLLCWGVAAVVVVLDQRSKAWALHHLMAGEIRPFLPGLLQLQRVSNSGAAFSLFTGAPLALAVISALVSAAVAVWLLLRPPERRWQALAAALLLGGAIGNGIDRWRLGAVVDFLQFVPVRFPIFNLADVAINLAVVCFGLDLLIPRRLPPGDRHG